VLSAEVYQYFDRRAWTMGVGADLRSETVRREVEHNAELSRELTLSLLWAVYAVGMVFAGIKRHYRPIRYFAIVLFALTILKVFTVDLATLDRVSKMLSVMGLGVFLLLASYLYQRVSRDAARQAKLDAAARASESQPPPAASEPAATAAPAAPSAGAPTPAAPAVSPEPAGPAGPGSGPAAPDGSPNDAH
jgi:Predicted membrane protein (DUF2339)